ncbi:TonB-dependent receptor [Ulvibacterium sp.]|uniref:TonB-dependent receptor n=1 Tax=Ulvibacterium sp. TaxID=2665914 RepID=UPI003BAB8CD8
MKLTFLLTVVSLIQIQANTYAQNKKITLDLENVTVREVIDEIESLSDYKFLLNRKDVDLNRTVSIKVKKKPIATVLSRLFRGTDVDHEVLNKQIILRKTVTSIIAPKHSNGISPPIEEIQYEVSGIVTDNEGVPLPGASIVEKGTTNGTQSDFDGNFSLDVADENAILVVSYIGFATREIAISGQSSIAIVLQESSEGLEEVVVVGYGTVRKSDVTGAVSTVASEDLTALPVQDVQQALRGRAAGVRVIQNSGQPGSEVQIQVRGGNSYLGNNNPLYVVDGFPVTGGIDFLNPADIQTIDILKDASATAIYGSRGANGVVMITTKGGRKGEQGRIEFDSYYGVQQVINTYDLMNSRQFAEIANIQAETEGAPMPFDLNNLPNIETDWQDLIFRSAGIQSHTLTFSGGSEKSSYSASANYFEQQGVIINSGLKRGSVRLALDSQVNDWARLTASAVVTRLENDNAAVNNGSGTGNNIFTAAIAAPPLLAPFDEEGNFTDVGAFPFSPVAINNPLAYAEILNQFLTTKALANMAVEFKLAQNLKFKVIGGVEHEFIEQNIYSPSILDNVSPTGSADTRLRRNTSFLNENILSYDKQIGENDNLSAVAGFTVQTFEGKFNRSRATDFPTDALLNNNLGSGATTLPNISEVEEWTLLSWLGRINYNLDNKYLFTASIRADGSSRFGENNKWGVFSSGAFAWKISNENFLKDSKGISDMKLRLGYGETGSTAIDPFQSLNRLDQTRGTFGNTDVIGFAPDRNEAPNPDLKWETTAQLGIGLDMAFLNDKYRLTVDYYDKRTKDLLAIIPLPGSVGFNRLITNLGEIKNYGMEFSVGATLSEGNFGWDMAGQLSFNLNEVITIGEDILGGNLDIPFAAPVNIAREGEPLGMFFGFREDGYDDQGVIQFVDLNGDGEISNEDQEIIGNPYPDFVYGLNNTFTYKNLQLNIFIEGSQGNDLFWATGGGITNSFSQGSNQLVDLYNDFWTPQNTDAAYPRPTENRSQFRVSERFIEDASFLRLRNIKLAYNLPVDKMDIGIKSLQIYVSGQNLLTLTDYPGLDPDVSTRQETGNLRIGIDQTGYPSAKIFTLGLNLQL